MTISCVYVETLLQYCKRGYLLLKGMQITQPLRVNVPDLDLILSVHAQEKPLAIGELQELGGDRGGGLEQRLRVVAAEQLGLPIPGGDGEDVEEGVVGEEGGVGGDAVVEGQPRAHVLGAQPADAAAVLLLGGLLHELLDEHGRSTTAKAESNQEPTRR